MDDRIVLILQRVEVRVQKMAAFVDGQPQENIQPLTDRERLVIEDLARHEHAVRVRAGTVRVDVDIHLERRVHRDDHLAGKPVGVLDQFLVALRVQDHSRVGGILCERILPSEPALLADPDEMVAVPLEEILRKKIQLLLWSQIGNIRFHCSMFQLLSVNWRESHSRRCSARPRPSSPRTGAGRSVPSPSSQGIPQRPSGQP